MFRKNMKWMYLAMVAIAIALAFFALGVRIGSAQAEDNVIGFCTNPKAVNYVGKDIIRYYKKLGYKVVNDGSCYFMNLKHKGALVTSLKEVSADEANWSYQRYVHTDYPMPKPTVMGCLTDPKARNFILPIYWEGYEIIVVPCIYDPLPEPSNAR
jgi:hypothetical protein